MRWKNCTWMFLIHSEQASSIIRQGWIQISLNKQIFFKFTQNKNSKLWSLAEECEGSDWILTLLELAYMIGWSELKSVVQTWTAVQNCHGVGGLFVRPFLNCRIFLAWLLYKMIKRVHMRKCWFNVVLLNKAVEENGYNGFTFMILFI